MLSDLKIHIVSFDNPYPPNYGGVIDVFYKLKSLHETGVSIHLHAFEYGRKPAKQLLDFCKEVTYYQRRNFVNPFIGSLPYIVKTRNAPELLDNLLKDDAPILFEGLHTCYFLTHPALAKRKKFVRMHNIEHEYYSKLEAVERSFFKKYFFSKEAQRLLEFEQVISHADAILAISPGDTTALLGRYSNVEYVPAFHPNKEITAKTGKGRFALYHGKLSVGENDEAARFLVEKVFSKVQMPFFIAGDKPSEPLKAMVAQYEHIQLFDKLSTEQISELMQEAHVNIIPTFQNTGIKLKLINVLFQGRFVLANDLMVQNTGLQSLCTVANEPEDMIAQLKILMNQTFTTDLLEHRQLLLDKGFSNQTNAVLLKKIIELA
jgi:hypothetical protein